MNKIVRMIKDAGNESAHQVSTVWLTNLREETICESAYSSLAWVACTRANVSPRSVISCNSMGFALGSCITVRIFFRFTAPHSCKIRGANWNAWGSWRVQLGTEMRCVDLYCKLKWVWESLLQLTWVQVKRGSDEGGVHWIVTLSPVNTRLIPA